jgi:RsiW-degrading membrane proteinase PrsW (M82 family)
MLSETNVLIIALVGGVVPALFWLWFWLREDRLRPEPKSALFSAFLGGIMAVLLALFFELIFYYLIVDANQHSIQDFPDVLKHSLQWFVDKYNIIDWQTNFWIPIQDLFDNFNSSLFNDLDIKRAFLVVILAPIIEEILKLILTYNICLRRKVNDEPVDASIYMLTSALGFAAIETMLFLTKPLADGNILDSLVATNFRSIGPMLIHLISSAVLGLFIGLAFYKGKFMRTIYMVFGLIMAILLHSIFNFFIILNDTTHNISYFWIACGGTWIMVFVLFFFFKKVKMVAKPIYKML